MDIGKLVENIIFGGTCIALFATCVNVVITVVKADKREKQEPSLDEVGTRLGELFMTDREKACIDALLVVREFCKVTKERLPCGLCIWGGQDGDCTLKINNKTPDEWNPSYQKKAML